MKWRYNKLVHQQSWTSVYSSTPDSKVHGANMGTIWGRQDPDGSHFGPINFAIWDPSGNSILEKTTEHIVYYLSLWHPRAIIFMQMDKNGNKIYMWFHLRWRLLRWLSFSHVTLNDISLHYKEYAQNTLNIYLTPALGTSMYVCWFFFTIIHFSYYTYHLFFAIFVFNILTNIFSTLCPNENWLYMLHVLWSVL